MRLMVVAWRHSLEIRSWVWGVTGHSRNTGFRVVFLVFDFVRARFATGAIRPRALWLAARRRRAGEGGGMRSLPACPEGRSQARSSDRYSTHVLGVEAGSFVLCVAPSTGRLVGIVFSAISASFLRFLAGARSRLRLRIQLESRQFLEPSRAVSRVGKNDSYKLPFDDLYTTNLGI